MHNALKKITLTFILVALLPVSFIIYELSTLNKNEEIIEEIYQNQLDAILYSVNQYSDDIMSSWANRINMEMWQNAQAFEDTLQSDKLTSLFSQMTPIKYVYFSTLENKSRVMKVNNAQVKLQTVHSFIDHVVKQNQDKIKRLITYHRAGFRKMEAIDLDFDDNKVPILFVLDDNEGKYKLGVMIVDLSEFIQQVLGPKMQAISQQEFIISAFREKNNSLVYSTSIHDGEDFKGKAPLKQALTEDAQKKTFWLLPGYYLAITLEGASIDDLVNDRMITSLIILSLLILILTFGIVFLYRNIRREVSLSQSKSEFVSNVSHEIRTPLSLISMYAETLEMGRVSEDKKKEYYGVIAKEAARLSRIVNRILNFSQIEASRKSYNLELLQLNEVCEEVLKSYSVHLKDKGFTYAFKPDSNLAMVMGDRESIIEALVNLIDNAMKYSKDKKHIVIETMQRNDHSCIEVKDEGIGIQKNYHIEIFDQFFRAPTGDVHNTKGSGLGLTLVKKTMEAHKGEVKVESELGRGSKFRLCFPIKEKNFK